MPPQRATENYSQVEQANTNILHKSHPRPAASPRLSLVSRSPDKISCDMKCGGNFCVFEKNPFSDQ